MSFLKEVEEWIRKVGKGRKRHWEKFRNDKENEILEGKGEMKVLESFSVEPKTD